MPFATRLFDTYEGLTRRLGPRHKDGAGLLLISSGGLGDTVLFSLILPRLTALAQRGETVTVLLRREAAKMAFLFPPDIQVQIVDYGRLLKNIPYRRSVFRILERARYRLVISTDYLRHPLLDEALLAACRAPETAAMEPRPWSKYDVALRRNRQLYGRLFDSGHRHVDKVVRWTNFANWLTGESLPPPLARLPENLLAPAASSDHPEVLIQPFSAVAAKQSPVALYETIIANLPAGFSTVVLGAPGDLDKHPTYRALMEHNGVSFDDSLFEDLVPRLRAAKLVISVDTALMHLAIAVGAPTLGLASAAYVSEIVPYAPEITPDNAHFLYQPMECQGCLGSCPKDLKDGMFPCVAKLDPDRILTKIKDLLT
ncbi:glycosyltransferase family 9 protein [Magnetospira sp. QH-2]|uniref:glycosyltransferase family 9 protein n=1 Tax=Magnetospira sp. (strain QH-2) TaxID=1288970 RepID=UPI0003E81990|nr:glycosyltransferase family 9 protein [Magnetospira sp. QH-2]CCQ74580.1 putative ADP-heptose:LPS heptosyltransferase [Magnetospira sp. QH-2]